MRKMKRGQWIAAVFGLALAGTLTFGVTFDAQLKDTKGALMPIMQHAQDIYGYLPIEVQTMISDETGIPLEKIYGVSTFYSQFALQPKGKYQISVCLGTACYVKGSGAILRN